MNEKDKREVAFKGIKSFKRWQQLEVIILIKLMMGKLNLIPRKSIEFNGIN